MFCSWLYIEEKCLWRKEVGGQIRRGSRNSSEVRKLAYRGDEKKYSKGSGLINNSSVIYGGILWCYFLR